MLTAKFLINEFRKPDVDDDDEAPLRFDPSIPDSFVEWAKLHRVKHFDKLILEEGIFSIYEIKRMVHLNFTLNIMLTYLSGFYNRNDLVESNLEEYSEKFARKEELINSLELVANKILKIKFKKKSFWYNKANAFSLLCLFMKRWDVIANMDIHLIKSRLDSFDLSVPEKYKFAAKEGVNNTIERRLRNRYLERLLIDGIAVEDLDKIENQAI